MIRWSGRALGWLTEAWEKVRGPLPEDDEARMQQAVTLRNWMGPPSLRRLMDGAGGPADREAWLSLGARIQERREALALEWER